MFKILNTGIFPFDVFVGYGISHRQFLDLLLKKKIARDIIDRLEEEQDDEKATADQGYCYNSDGTNFVWTAAQNPAVLAHELLHATFNILETVDITYNDDNQEIFTYMLQHLMQQMLREKN